MLSDHLCWLQGILYEDTYLQIGLQSRYTQSTGELLLFLGNKQAAQPLTGLGLVLSAPSPAVHVVVGQLPARLSPKQQIQVCRDYCYHGRPTTGLPAEYYILFLVAPDYTRKHNAFLCCFHGRCSQFGGHLPSDVLYV